MIVIVVAHLWVYWEGCEQELELEFIDTLFYLLLMDYDIWISLFLVDD
jgi:hypothetical protein